MAHPKKGAYNPTSDKFDAEQMASIMDSLNVAGWDYTEEDVIRVADFIQGKPLYKYIF